MQRRACADANLPYYVPIPTDVRRELAALLYGPDYGMAQEQIAEVLSVNQSTVARDLDGVMRTHNPDDRRKGGRPKGSTSKPKPESQSEPTPKSEPQAESPRRSGCA